MVLSAVSVSRRMMESEAPASCCQVRGSFEPGGSWPQWYPRDGRCPVPTRDAPPPLPADLVALLSDAHAAWTSFADQRNALPSRSMRWRMTRDRRKVGGQAATAIGGCGPLAG